MKLLIVDDDAALCKMLKEFFQESIADEILTANTPTEALRLLEKEQPDGMLLDVNLQARLTGFDVLSRARTISRATKTMVMTSLSDFESIEKARRLGAVDYITKPFTLSYLSETVRAKLSQVLEFA